MRIVMAVIGLALAAVLSVAMQSGRAAQRARYEAARLDQRKAAAAARQAAPSQPTSNPVVSKAPRCVRGVDTFASGLARVNAQPAEPADPPNLAAPALRRSRQGRAPRRARPPRPDAAEADGDRRRQAADRAGETGLRRLRVRGAAVKSLLLLWLGLWLGLCLGCSTLAPKTNPLYPLDLINPGVKVGYTWGNGGRWTYGFDLSVIASTGKNMSAIVGAGPEVNFTWRSGGTFDARLGLDLVSWMIGWEIGPSIVVDAQNHSHFGLGITTWASAVFFDPYWTYTIVFGGRPGSDLSEWGTYAKLPICVAGGCNYSSSGDGSHWWHIDD
jgi:hypothetical protein